MAEAVRERVIRKERYSVLEAAQIVGCPVSEIIELAREGMIPRAANLFEDHWSFEIRTFRRWAKTYVKQPRKHRPARLHYTGAQVYFIQAGAFVKIGFSVQVEKRMRSIQCHSPEPVRLLFSMPGSMHTEREFHKRFATYRAMNEWFRLEGELAEFIKEKAR